MINKDSFIKRMSLIQNFHSEQNTLQALTDKITNGYAVVDFGDYLVDEMLNMLDELLNNESKDLLSWWLYEDVEKIIYNQDGSKLCNVEALSDLYEYIVDPYKNKTMKEDFLEGEIFINQQGVRIFLKKENGDTFTLDEIHEKYLIDLLKSKGYMICKKLQ